VLFPFFSLFTFVALITDEASLVNVIRLCGEGWLACVITSFILAASRDIGVMPFIYLNVCYYTKKKIISKYKEEKEGKCRIGSITILRSMTYYGTN